MQAVRNIQNLQTPVVQADANNIHYGYTAFRDISLRDTLSIAHRVQPPKSDFFGLLPAKELLPFVSIQVPDEPDAESPQLVRTSSNGYSRAAAGQRNENGDILDPTVIWKPKLAFECIREIADVYAEFGFVVLKPLTGMNEKDAFAIFQTIQPFTYKLKDILDEFYHEAPNRINQTAVYEVSYGDLVVDLEPLREDLKPIAFAVLEIMKASAEKAVELAQEVVANTTQKMEQFFATGSGKKIADPLDAYVFPEMDEQIPRLVSRSSSQQNNATGQIEDVLLRLASVLTQNQTNNGSDKERLLDEKIAELDSFLKSQKGVSVGDAVTVAGENAIVIAKPFGKVKVRKENGEEVTVDKSEIE